MKATFEKRLFNKIPGFLVLVILALGLALSLTNNAQAQPAQVDGFCVMDVLAMERAEHVDPMDEDRVNTKDLLVYEEALERARLLYAAEDVYYSTTLEILVHEGNLLVGTDAYSDDQRMMGVKISLWLNGDEDIITYYFYVDLESETKELKLKMFLHDEQTASAFWPCEV
jgi:hypothetical protein